LQTAVRATGDVAADVVRVVGVELRRRRDMAGEHGCAEAGSEPFDLPLDCTRRIAAVAVRHMRVHPQGVLTRGCARVIEDRRLDHQDERSFGHPTRGDVGLSGNQFGEAADHMHGAGAEAVRVRPWNRRIEGIVDLERSGPMPKSSQPLLVSSRQRVACDRRELGGVRVEEHHAVRRQVRERGHHRSCSDLAAE